MNTSLGFTVSIRFILFVLPQILYTYSVILSRDFYKEKGLEVWIKPHPREKELDIYASLGAKIIYEKNIAQEVLLMKMKKPKYLLSLYSTTLVTAPLINGVPSVCLGKLSLNSEGFTNSYKKYVEKFINKFKNITMVIDSWEELPFEVTDEE